MAVTVFRPNKKLTIKIFFYKKILPTPNFSSFKQQEQGNIMMRLQACNNMHCSFSKSAENYAKSILISVSIGRRIQTLKNQMSLKSHDKTENGISWDQLAIQSLHNFYSILSFRGPKHLSFNIRSSSSVLSDV